MSNEYINKLGQKIAEGEIITEDNLNDLQNFRISYATPLSETFQEITRISDKIHRASIVAFRLKRIGTIINKMKRMPKLKLSRMGDVAGIRCIFYNTNEVYKFVELIKNDFIIKGKIRDYIKYPKEIGYKAVHLHIQDKKTGKIIELQVRTLEFHNWATLIEITDFLYSLRLKELGFNSNQKFAEFHSLLSSDKDLTESEANLIYEILNERDFILTLSDTFRKNSKHVKKQWLGLKRNDSFHLITAKKEDIPKIESFNNFEKAEAAYYEKYKQDNEAEIVLTYIRKPNFQQISIAYANYILSYHTFMRDIEPILEQLAIDAIEDKNFKKFRNIFLTYEKLQVSLTLNFLSDSAELIFSRLEKRKILITKGKSLSRSQEKKIRDNLNETYREKNIKYQEFIGEVYQKLPANRFMKYLFKNFLKKHNKRVVKILKNQNIVFEDLKENEIE